MPKQRRSSTRRRKVMYGGADEKRWCESDELERLIDGKEYDKVLNCHLSRDTGVSEGAKWLPLLQYIVTYGHHPLWVALMQAKLDLVPHSMMNVRALIDELLRAQKNQDYLTPFIDNDIAVKRLPVGDVLVLFEKFPNYKLVEKLDPRLVLRKTPLTMINEMVSRWTPEQQAKVYRELLEGRSYLNDDVKEILLKNKNGLMSTIRVGIQDDPETVTFDQFRNVVSEQIYTEIFQKVVNEEAVVAAPSTNLAELLKWKIYPLFEKYLTADLIDLICKQVSAQYLTSFNFKDLLFKVYFETHGNVTNYDKYIKDAVDKGFAISGSTNFTKFLDDLRKRLSTLAQEFKKKMDRVTDINIETAIEKYQERIDSFLAYFAEVYADIFAIIEYTDNLGPRAIDALYLYAYSSAVVNEPFKSVSYTKTQRKLEAQRRRPTELQYEYIAIMDEIIRNAPKTTRPIYAWRGVAVPSFDVVNLELDIFKSLSLSPDVSLSYLRDESCCLMRVLVPAGVPLVAMDPVQSFKNQGGLYEFVLPRGAIFKLVDTKEMKDPLDGSIVTIYDTQVNFEASYEESLAVGRLRKRREVATPIGRAQFTSEEVSKIGDIIVDAIRHDYNEIRSESDTIKVFEKFRSNMLFQCVRWRGKKLASGQKIDDRSYTSFIQQIAMYVADSLHPTVKVNFLSELRNLIIDLNMFFEYAKNMRQSPF